jgi:hypothetical protein
MTERRPGQSFSRGRTASAWPGAAGVPGDGGGPLGAPGLAGGAEPDGVGVGAQDDVGGEHGQQRVEVAVAGGGEEGVDQGGLAQPVRLPGRALVPHACPGAARQLAGRRGAAVDHRGDLVEGDGEDVVEDERDPLDGRRRRRSGSRGSGGRSPAGGR